MKSLMPLRIAIITYDISPYRGSEASVSWNFVKNMSQYVNLTVIYGGGKDEVETYLKDNTISGVEWINVPTQDVERFGRGLRQDFYYTVFYRRWHKTVSEIIGRLVDEKKIDLIHYLNPIGFKEPGWAWKIKEVPYVWGPVQGVDNRPLRLLKALGIKGAVQALVRRVVHNGLFRFHPRVRKAFRRADALFAATPASVVGLAKYHGRNDAVYLPENGIMEMARINPITLSEDETLRMVWIGSLDMKRKAIGLLFDALLNIRHGNWHIDILGDGTLSRQNEIKANKLGANVTIHGKQPRDKVQEIISKAHLHIITSLGEATTTVLWEAMSKAVPTLSLDHCGMSGVICDKCGIKIPIQSYRLTTECIASKINNILENPDTVRNLSQGVLDCSQRFMWKNRIALFLETYRSILSKREMLQD